MTQPYLKRARAPRRLLYRLTVIPSGEDLFVEQAWYGQDMSNSRRFTYRLRGAHAKMPIPHVYEWDYTSGAHNMVLVLKQLGLPSRRVLVTEYAFSLTQAR